MHSLSSKSRPPAVADMFYPGEPGRLSAALKQLLQGAQLPQAHPYKALICPHAGYIYSGAVAAEAYASLMQRPEITRVVLLGPSHRVPLRGMAVPGVDSFTTPLGEVPLDVEACRSLLGSEGLVISDEAHQYEHSLEVQLPFLQAVLSEFHLVPIVVGLCAPRPVANILRKLWGGRETLIVVSSDLSHYLPQSQARIRDQQTAERILAGATDLEGEEACGCYAVNGLLMAAREKQLTSTLIAMATSGDTAGDKSRVVGYGAFGFFA